MEDVGEECRQEELSRGQALDEAHGRPTARTRPRRTGRGGGGRFGGRWGCHGERLTTLGQLAGACARGEEAEIADADEALREDVHEEAAEKFIGLERERAHHTAVPVVLPPKRDGVGGDVDEPVVGDGDAVRVARQVVEDVRRAAEGRSRIDNPGLLIEGPQPRAKGGRGASAARVPG